VRLLTFAPAKVNLVLQVGPLRPDGYHELRTLMVPLDLCDRVEVRVSRRPGSVSCRVPGLPELSRPANLAARAAAAFRKRFGTPNGVAVRIDKRIPVTAGLGGGSSDAAAVLRCLARAFAVEDPEALRQIALSVGSDVPFFLGSGPAWAAGRGELLTPFDLDPLDLVLVFPEDPALAIRSGDAYRWLDKLRTRRGSRRRFSRPHAFTLSRVGNDLQTPCLAHRPALASLMGLLRGAGARVVMLSGSGPTVFGIFSGMGAARSAALSIQAEEGRGAGLRVIAVRTVQRLPRVTSWRSPRSASSPSTRRSSRRT